MSATDSADRSVESVRAAAETVLYRYRQHRIRPSESDVITDVLAALGLDPDDKGKVVVVHPGEFVVKRKMPVVGDYAVEDQGGAVPPRVVGPWGIDGIYERWVVVASGDPT